MTLYITIQLLFIYFKIARVHYKEEECTRFWKVQHAIVLLVAFLTFIYAFSHWAWYMVLLVSFLSFVIAAMIVVAVQLGIFIDGKPLLGMKAVYDNSLYLIRLLCILCVIVWIL